MSALDGFYATWNDARNTFGEGTPQGGSQIDASPTFSKLGEDVQAAAPGDTWTGAGSEAYGGANKKHGENLTKLADLDQRLAAQLDQAADVVTTGRGNLDAVRQWVTDAANSVPPGKQRDELLMKIANSGLGQVSEIVQTSNDANNTIRDNMNNLKPEFEAIGFKEEKGEGDDPLAAQGDEEDKPGEEKDDKSAEEQGKKDGEALAEQAAKPTEEPDPAVLDQVADNLPGSPLTQQQIEALARGEQVDNVPRETLDYYREFYQAAGKDGLLALDRHLESQEAAGNAEAGQQRDKLANGLTVTSNENIVERNPDGTIADRGGYDQLPPDLREMIEFRRGDAIPGERELGFQTAWERQVSDLSQFGELMGEANPGYQPGTELGTELYMKAADMVGPTPEGWPMRETTHDQYEQAASNFAEIAGRNNEASYQIWSGNGETLPDGYKPEETVRKLLGHDWSEASGDGRGAATLLDWITEDSQRGPDDPIGDRARQALTEVPDMLAPSDSDPVWNSMQDSFARNDAISTEMSQMLAANTEALYEPGMPGGFEETRVTQEGRPLLSADDAHRLLQLGSMSEEGRGTLATAVQAERIDELKAVLGENPSKEAVDEALKRSAAGSLSGRIDSAMVDAINHKNSVLEGDFYDKDPAAELWRAKQLGAEIVGSVVDEAAGKIPGYSKTSDILGFNGGELVEGAIKEYIDKPDYKEMPIPDPDNQRAGAAPQAKQAILQAAYDLGELPPELMATDGKGPIDVSEEALAGSKNYGIVENYLDERGLQNYVQNYYLGYGVEAGAPNTTSEQSPGNGSAEDDGE